MKNLFKSILFLFLLFSSKSFSQEKTRFDFAFMTIQQDGKWGDIQSSKSIFVFGDYEAKELVQYWETGNKTTYTIVKKFQYVESDGEIPGYMTGTVLDDQGLELVINLMEENGGLFILFSVGNCLHFHN